MLPDRLPVEISTHTPHAGSDDNKAPKKDGTVLFQPTLPMRGVTRERSSCRTRGNISTHTPHAGSDRVVALRVLRREISTHTPHAGSDSRFFRFHQFVSISTHTPHAGSDL